MSENRDTDTLGSTLGAFFGGLDSVAGEIQMPVLSTEERAEQDAQRTARADEALAQAIAQADDC